MPSICGRYTPTFLLSLQDDELKGLLTPYFMALPWTNRAAVGRCVRHGLATCPPEVRELLRNIAIVPTPTTPDEFAALIKSDGDRYRRIIRDANVRIE